jgi:gamma-butyrobetaine dioxygenase
MQPVRLPFDQAEAMYAAYRAWAEMVARPEFALRLRLAPGDCLVFDNTRILHARTAFFSPPPPASSASGSAGVSGVAGVAGSGESAAREDAPAPAERHLQGCYADLDGLLSTLGVLRRDRVH